MGGAHLDADSGADTQPLALLGTGLRLEGMAHGALDGRPGEDRVTEQSAAARSDAGEGLAVVDDVREAHVVTGPPGDPRDVTAARLVEGDRVRVRLADPGDCLLHDSAGSAPSGSTPPNRTGTSSSASTCTPCPREARPPRPSPMPARSRVRPRTSAHPATATNVAAALAERPAQGRTMTVTMHRRYLRLASDETAPRSAHGDLVSCVTCHLALVVCAGGGRI